MINVYIEIINHNPTLYPSIQTIFLNILDSIKPSRLKEEYSCVYEAGEGFYDSFVLIWNPKQINILFVEKMYFVQS